MTTKTKQFDKPLGRITCCCPTNQEKAKLLRKLNIESYLFPIHLNELNVAAPKKESHGCVTFQTSKDKS